MTLPNIKLWQKLKLEDIARNIERQKEFCKNVNLPCFIEDDGICPFCKQDLFIRLNEHQICDEQITSCSNCNRSLVE